MNVLSTFNGFGCLWIAMEQAGIKVDKRYISEIDKYANKVNKYLYPDSIQLGDVTKVDGYKLPKIDLLTAGSPCQGFSLAGNQLNFSDPRSRLFFEFVRLRDELKPKYWIFENVKMKQEIADAISGYLGVQGIFINSLTVSGQDRKRWYWTNIPGIKQPKNEGILLKDVIESGQVDREKSLCVMARVNGATAKRYLTKSMHQMVFDEGKWRKLTVRECARLQTVPEDIIDKMINSGVSASQLYKMIGNGWTVKVITHLLKAMQKDIENKKSGI